MDWETSLKWFLLRRFVYESHRRITDFTPGTLQLKKVFASDAHGDSAVTASKRFKQGAGRMFIQAAEEADVNLLLASHPIILTSEFMLQNTLVVS